jgi:hypothetical protein
MQQIVFRIFLFIILPYLPVYTFWLYELLSGIKKRDLRHNCVLGSINISYKLSCPIELGVENSIYFQVNNPADVLIKNAWLRAILPDNMVCINSHVSLGNLPPLSSSAVSLTFVPLCAGNSNLGYFDVYFELEKRKHIKNQLSLGNHVVECSHLLVDSSLASPLKFGFESIMAVKLQNRFSYPLTNIRVECFFAKGLDFDSASFDIIEMQPGSVQSLKFNILPKNTEIKGIGYFNISFTINGRHCQINAIEFDRNELILPDLDIRLNIPDYFYKDIPATIGIVTENRSEDSILNVCFSSCFPSFVDCQLPTVCINKIESKASRYASIDLIPNVSGKINFGNLNISFEVNGVICQKEPLYLGTHNVA